MLSDRPMRTVPDDGVEPVRPEWATLVDEVVARVRLSFGDAVADEIEVVLRERTTQAHDALDTSFAAAEQRLDDTTRALADIDQRIDGLLSDAAARHERAVALSEAAAQDRAIARTLREEAESLNGKAAEAHVAAEVEFSRLQTERATLQARLDNLRAPLEAREAELIAWEAELADRAERLEPAAGSEPQRAPVAPLRQPHDSSEPDAQLRLLRSQWRTLSGNGTTPSVQRGWSRRGRSDDRSEPEAR